MAATAAFPRANGNSSADQNEEALAVFYEQLSKLRDDVLENVHPRLKLSAAAREKLKAAVPHNAAADSALGAPSLANGVSSGAGAHNDVAFARNSSISAQKALTQQGTFSALSQHSLSSSGIDPVLLTKSDDLLRAEAQLKRQRIERDLKETWDQKKHSSRDRDSGAEPQSLFSLSEVLRKALDLVKPVSGLPRTTSNGQEVASDSFDTNSYYSSQANDWSSESSAALNVKAQSVTVGTGISAAKPAPPTFAQTLPGLASNVSHSTTRAPETGLPDKQQFGTPNVGRYQVYEAGPDYNARDSEDVYDVDGDESDYSPPAAETFTDIDADGEAMDIDDDDDSEYTPQNALPVSGTAISPPVPIITNHLTHLAAPQAARVSPLAVAKMPGLESVRGEGRPYQYHGVSQQHASLGLASHPPLRPETDDSTTSPRNSGQRTPAGPPTRSQRKAHTRANKKRKRELEKVPKPRKQKTKRAAITPPVAVIKEEPMSPPPFMFSGLHSASGNTRAPYPLPPDVEIVSPGEFNPRNGGYYGQAAQPYAHEVVASPGTPGPYRRIRRDDQDLRRVASLHAAYRPPSPEHPIYSPVGPYRAASSQFPTTHGLRTSTHHPEVVEARPIRHAQPEMSASPPQFGKLQDPYVPRIRSPATMIPPPAPVRRIVMDQYGNRYYATGPQPSVPIAPVAPRASVAPAHRAEPQIIYERAPSRASVAYAPRPPATVYADESMGPPSIRRVSARTHAAEDLHQIYRQTGYTSDAQEDQIYHADNMSPSMPPPTIYRTASHVDPGPASYDHRTQRQYSHHPAESQYRGHDQASMYVQEALPPPHRPQTAYDPANPAVAGVFTRGYSARPELQPPIRYVSRQPSMAPRAPTEYSYRMDHAGQPLRAVSVMPGYAPPSNGEVRYSYAPSAQPPVRY